MIRRGLELSGLEVSGEVEIGIAGEEDREGVLRLLKVCGIFFQGEEEWLTRSTTLVAREDGRIVGTRSFERITDQYYRVYGLCVLPEARGRGIGVELCRRAEDIMFRNGARGYIGDALSEELAQYYVRKLGVRICRFSMRGWRNNTVPYRKEFRQSGVVDSALRRLQRLATCLARNPRLRFSVEILESAARRIKPV